MTTPSKVIQIARGEIGVREGRSSSGSWNNRVKYNDWYVSIGRGEVYRNASWCAIFVSWVARKAGVPTSVIPNHAYTPTGWNWFKSRGRDVTNPRPGDILYVYYPSRGRIGHVGIVERRSGSYIYTIEGNTNTTGSSQGNGVYRLRRKITKNLFFARPDYAKVKPSAPQKSPATPKPQPASSLRLVSVVDVSNLKSARYSDPPKKGTPHGPYANEVYTLETALAKTGWLSKNHVDGHYGMMTVGDGSLGVGGCRGFQRKHSGAKHPDGWLGPKELRKLFELANMNVTVKD